MSHKSILRERVEYSIFWLALQVMGRLPRPLARHFGVSLATLFSWMLPKKLQTARSNLDLAFPEWSEKKKRSLISQMIRQMGWMGAEFTHFPKYDKKSIEQIVLLDGFENYLNALEKGNGVLLMSAHMSAFELFPIVCAHHGYPIHFLVRSIDNTRVNEKVNEYRSISESRPIDKKNSAHKLLKILKLGGTVGILIDQNTLPSEGIFVNFFGRAACTSTGLARLALTSQAAVVPAFILWDESLGKYLARFDPPLDIIRTGNKSFDIQENTQRFTCVIEKYVRRYPDQWNWIHNRWKNQPHSENP